MFHIVKLAIQVQMLSSGRGIIGGLTAMAQVLRLVGFSAQARQVFRQRMLNGDEPLFGGIRQRVIRLCGRYRYSPSPSHHHLMWHNIRMSIDCVAVS